MTADLSIHMIGALGSGQPSTNSARVIGHAATLNALRRRGLIGDDNRWTALGRQVAASTISSRVYTLDELHEMARGLYLQEQAVSH
jgi:hypothetical protein